MQVKYTLWTVACASILGTDVLFASYKQGVNADVRYVTPLEAVLAYAKEPDHHTPPDWTAGAMLIEKADNQEKGLRLLL